MATHLYETLNLSRSATSDEVRKAYKKLALRTHPDRAPPERKQEAEEEFRRVNAAYEVLIDEEKREIYDRHGVYPPPEPPVEHVYTNPHARQPPHSMPFPTPPSHFERQSRRHHRPPPRSADPFHQTFNEPLFPSTAPPGSGPFGNPFQFTDPFKLFQGVFPGLPPQHILPHSMRFSPMFPIVGGPEFIVHPDHVPPFRPSNANVVWTEERRTTKIANGREETVWTRIDQDGNVRRTFDVNGRHWETFNDEIVQPYETVYDTHHERIDYPPPPPSSQGRSHKSSTSKKSRYPSPGYSYASATPHPPPPPPSHHIRTTSQHVPNRRPPYRRMHTYSEEDLGAPLSDTENIRPYSYEFAPRDGPRYEEYHYPISSREQHTKRRHERPVPLTPPRERDPDVSHRRTTRPDRPYATVHGEYPEPEPAFIPPSLEHEVKDKRWWQKLKV